MRGPAVVAVAFVVMLAAGCGNEPTSDLSAVLDALPASDTTTTAPPSDDAEATTTTSPSQGDCASRHLEAASLRPDAHALAGDAEAIAAIRERRVLRVGVDENTLGFSYRDPGSGEIKGFEVDLATAIAARIFGDDGAGRVDLVPVVTSEKFDVVEDGTVDMTISANTMSCARWEQVAFSTEYYTAHQQFLVRNGSPIRVLADLAGATVCVTSGSTSALLLRAQVPEAELYQVPDRTGCLVALQEGEVDAYFGHDSFLYGMLKQDPETLEIRDKILPPDVAVSHYGIAIASDHTDLVRFVNAALEDIRDHEWRALHVQLEDELRVPPADPPQAQYRD